MDEKTFLQNIQNKALETGINPLLLISGFEGLYTFKDVELNSINYDLLDSLILSIFALRIGDEFHTIAEKNLLSENEFLIQSAAKELKPLTDLEIKQSDNAFIASFAGILKGKSVIRNYHIKALDVAAIEIKKLQLIYNNDSVGLIILDILKNDKSFGLNSLFN